MLMPKGKYLSSFLLSCKEFVERQVKYLINLMCIGISSISQSAAAACVACFDLLKGFKLPPNIEDTKIRSGPALFYFELCIWYFGIMYLR